MKLESTAATGVAALTLALVAGCASGSTPKQADEGALRCPPAHTMTCEADKIGRIFHGSFSKSVDKCTCVPDDGRTLETPVIPSTRR